MKIMKRVKGRRPVIVDDVDDQLDVREPWLPPDLFYEADTFNYRGLNALVGSAVAEFEEKYPHVLPYNLYGNSPHAPQGLLRQSRRDCGEVEYAARLAGWLRAVASNHPLMASILKEVTTPSGVWSPYNLHHPGDFVRVFGSPGRAERIFLRVRRQANEILKPYGLRVSVRQVVRAMFQSPRRKMKATRRAAAEALVWRAKKRFGVDINIILDPRYPHGVKPWRIFFALRGFGELRSLDRRVGAWAISAACRGEFASVREALAQKDRLVQDSTDGVEMLTDPAGSYTRQGVTATLGWRLYDDQVLPIWLVRCGPRTYHWEFHFQYDGFGSPREAIRRAISAWHKQRQAEKDARRSFPHLLREDCSILVMWQDSYAAGNCQAGTAEFARQHGWRNRHFVPAAWLLRHAADTRVARVLAVANKKAEALFRA